MSVEMKIYMQQSVLRVWSTGRVSSRNFILGGGGSSWIRGHMDTARGDFIITICWGGGGGGRGGGGVGSVWGGS